MAVDTANAQTDYDIYKEQNRIATKQSILIIYILNTFQQVILLLR